MIRQDAELTDLDRTIVALGNLDTGEAESALDLLRLGEASIFQLRRLVEERVQEERPIYVCDECGQPVVIRSHRVHNTTHTFYFKHLHKSGDCPIKTDSTFTRDEIRCMKYNGAKESPAHYNLKTYIADQLRKDDRFSGVAVEKVIKGSGWSKNRKKPDISALYEGRRVVFEIQLSTTFLDVIVSREVFYENEAIAIFWIFLDLDPVKCNATEKDVYFSNKSNALSISKQSKLKTSQLEELVFIGHYIQPYYNEQSRKIEERWQKKDITFSDIKFDPETHKPYFVDYDTLYQEAIVDEDQAKIAGPISRFEALALDNNPHHLKRRSCAAELTEAGLYNDEDIAPGFLKLVKALLSVRDGKVHFANQDNKWAWVTNYVWEHHIDHWIVFLYAVNGYQRPEMVFPPYNQKIKEKRDYFKDYWRSDIKLKQQKAYYPLLSRLLPEIHVKLIMYEQ